MRRVMVILLVVALSLTFAACGESEEVEEEVISHPNLILYPSVAAPQEEVTILASGLTPGERVEVLVRFPDYAIRWAQGEANEYGAFSATYEVPRKMFDLVAYTMELVNEDGELLATAPLMMFVEEEG